MIDLKSPLQRGILGWVMFAIVMVLLPHIVNTGTTRTFVFAMYLAIFAISWDVMSGRTGYISFGHPFLIGIGGYTSALLTYHLHWPLYFSIPAAIVMTMIGGALFFFPALRIRGTYFALVTLAFMELIYGLVQVIAPQVTGGTRGLSGLASLVTGAIPNYYLVLVVLLILGFSMWLLIRTQMGTALSAIGMDEDAVRASGLNVTRLKLFAFMMSAFAAGLGGALYVHYLGSIAPRALFDVGFLFQILVACLLGGAGTITGPIAGAFFLTFLLEWLRPYIPGSERFLIYGTVALVLYVMQPNGLHEMVRHGLKRIGQLTPGRGAN